MHHGRLARNILTQSVWLYRGKPNTCSNTWHSPLPQQSGLTFRGVEKEMLKSLKGKENWVLSHENKASFLFLRWGISGVNWLNSCVLSFITHWHYGDLSSLPTPVPEILEEAVKSLTHSLKGGGRRDNSWTMLSFWGLQGNASISMKGPNLR